MLKFRMQLNCVELLFWISLLFFLCIFILALEEATPCVLAMLGNESSPASGGFSFKILLVLEILSTYGLLSSTKHSKCRKVSVPRILQHDEGVS